MNFQTLFIAKKECTLGFATGSVIPVILTLLALVSFSQPAHAIPAFARKYNLPCSACHEAWPKLNNFGQVFRDNGYQLGNGKDSPIWQNPSYWPVTFRITPQWHRESSSNQKVDSIPGDATSPPTETKITSHGSDLSGVDIWAAGTLYNNISFSVLPSSDSSGSFHFENAWVRFDNLLGSQPWLWPCGGPRRHRHRGRCVLPLESIGSGCKGEVANKGLRDAASRHRVEVRLANPELRVGLGQRRDNLQIGANGLAFRLKDAREAIKMGRGSHHEARI